MHSAACKQITKEPVGGISTHHLDEELHSVTYARQQDTV